MEVVDWKVSSCEEVEEGAVVCEEDAESDIIDIVL
jgi:hypothetical protein